MPRDLLKLTQINADPALQSRVRIDEAVVDEYATALRKGAKLPPVVVSPASLCSNWSMLMVTETGAPYGSERS